MKRSINRKRFETTVNTILKQHNEDNAFKMYLAYSANMLNEPISFSDYMNGLKSGSVKKQKQEKQSVKNEFMTKKETEKFIEKCNLELKNFTPPPQKGGRING